jgi:hypothetical protein
MRNIEITKRAIYRTKGTEEYLSLWIGSLPILYLVLSGLK